MFAIRSICVGVNARLLEKKKDIYFSYYSRGCRLDILMYTRLMTDCCMPMRKPQAQDKPLDEPLAEAVAKDKRERQAVLARVRTQRAISAKRLAARVGRL
jgi:hypothetical protein